MPFDTTYSPGASYVAIPLGFIASSSATFNPEQRDDTQYMGRNESDMLGNSIHFLDPRVRDFAISWRYSGFASNSIATAIVQGPTPPLGTIQVVEKEFDNQETSRPRKYLIIQGLSKKTSTPTASGPEISIWMPSDNLMASLAVIIDAEALAKVRNFHFTLTRVTNTAGNGPITAGKAVKFDTSGQGTGGTTKVVVCTGAGGEDFYGITAEDIADGGVGACYSAAGGGAAFIPSTDTPAGAAPQDPVYLGAGGALLDAPGTQQIGVWKHKNVGSTASILQLGTTL